MVVVVTIRILIGQAAQIRIGLEQIDGKRTGGCERIGWRRSAGIDLVTHQTAEICWIGRQRRGQCAGHALIQILNESGIAKALRIGNCGLSSKRRKRSLKNRQRGLAGEIVIDEGLSFSVGDVDVEILLGLNELLQETILEDIDLIPVLTMPHVSGLVTHVTYLESGRVCKLTLNAEAPVLYVR